MKKKVSKAFLMGLILLGVLSFKQPFQSSGTTKVKCMIQLTNYSGEGAYIVVSVLDSTGNYLNTLQVLGDDYEWYPDLTAWWSYFQPLKKSGIDAISGATISGGERSIFILEIEESLIDSNHTLRFETAVEDQKYYESDLEIPLTSENTRGSFNGTGYIRYVRIIPN